MKRFNYVATLFVLLLSFTATAAEQIYFVQTDHLGAPEMLTDENQTIVWQASQDPFANSAPITEQVTFDFRFPGQYYDAESGLFYNWNRYYDAGLGRYVTSDPIGLLGGANTYAYVGGNPLIRVDVVGLAYFAKRPLQGMPWLGGLSCGSDKSILNRFNKEISHEHIFFEDGKSPANIGFGPNGLFTETNPTGYRPQDGGYNDCIMRIAYKRVPPGVYSLTGNNCQAWAAKVREEYHKIKNTSLVDKCKQCVP